MKNKGWKYFNQILLWKLVVKLLLIFAWEALWIWYKEFQMKNLSIYHVSQCSRLFSPSSNLFHSPFCTEETKVAYVLKTTPSVKSFGSPNTLLNTKRKQIITNCYYVCDDEQYIRIQILPEYKSMTTPCKVKKDTK